MESHCAPVAVALNDQVAIISCDSANLSVPVIAQICLEANCGVLSTSTLNETKNSPSRVRFAVAYQDSRTPRIVAEKLRHETNSFAVEVDEDVSVVSLIGGGFLSNPAAVSSAFEALSANGVAVKQSSISQLSVSFLVSRSQNLLAAKALHQAFDLQIKVSKDNLHTTKTLLCA